jgi:hypothetical protein
MRDHAAAVTVLVVVDHVRRAAAVDYVSSAAQLK